MAQLKRQLVICRYEREPKTAHHVRRIYPSGLEDGVSHDSRTGS